MTTSSPLLDTSMHAGDDDHHDPEYTDAMMYGYGTASVAIISCLALLGITIFPTLKSRVNEYLVQFFIALGVGTMTADALIHIIPEVLGLHVHQAGEEPHDEDHHEHEEETSEVDHATVVWKMSVVYGGVFLFFLFENGLKVWKTRRQLAPSVEPIEETGKKDLDHHKSNHATSFANGHVVDNDLEATPSKMETILEEQDGETSSKNDTIICWRFTTVMLTVFTGDILHNFADGMAIGVSFATSATAGIGTSIAVLCHELPHEYGDFAIYLKNGASKWQAIGLNVAAALCSFIGLYVGVAASHNTTARQWLLAVVAGMFLYIALVQVMVELVRPAPETNRVWIFAIQIFGLSLGWTLMLLLGLYEEDIESSIG